MIDYARPQEYNMHLPTAPPDSVPLEDFQVFNKKWPNYYTEYYTSFEPYETELDTSTNTVFRNLTSKEYQPVSCEEWRYKYIVNWTEDDTLSWFVDTVRSLGLSEYDLPMFTFRIPGLALRGLRREQIIEMLNSPALNPMVTRRNGELVFEKLLERIAHDDNIHGVPSVLKYGDSNSYHRSPENVSTMLDLDSPDNKKNVNEYINYERLHQLPHSTHDSSDETDEYMRHSDTASPECSYGSDASKSGDEGELKRKMQKRPGRPKGSGKKITKRPRSVSVPEFLRNLLHNPMYCPSIIRWEDYNAGMFRFVKPDEVAKLWGDQKQNNQMNFEKFSRAMRYHYRQSVLVSVPTLRLVYKFGPRGPDYKTDNPNFTKSIKSHLL